MNNSAFKVYKSSAGSGKTTTLVQEYLRIALVNPSRFKEIVAITFTIKATNEMKLRVIDTLIDISNGIFKPEMDALFDDLLANFSLNKPQIIQNAADLLSKILHGYSYFAFSTIDSFVVKIVRAFAFDLKLSMNFGIELNRDIIIEESVSELLSQAGYDSKLTSFLSNYIENQLDNQSDTRIPVLLADLSKVLFNDSYNLFVDHIKNISADELFQFAEDVLSKTQVKASGLRKIGEEVLDLLHNNGLAFSDFFQGNKGVPKFFENLSLLNHKGFNANSFVIKAIDDDVWYSKSVPSHIALTIDSIKDEIRTQFANAQAFITDYISFYAVRKNVEAMALLKLMQMVIQGYYSENNVIHLSETLKRISEVVDQEQTPFIYERIGNQYNHYLIDEFQDTSLRQWLNLLPLVDDSLSAGHFNLIVGDAKQSIYRWRGADFEQFVRMPFVNSSESNSILKSREANLIRNYNEVALNKNYRSATTVVDFNNAFFSFCKSTFINNEIVQDVFNGFEQVANKNTTGYVEVSLFDNEKVEENAFKFRLLLIINELTNRGLKFSDITVLGRGNKNLSQVAQWLLEANIPIISSQSLHLMSSPNTQFLINVLRWMLQPKDRVSALAVFSFLYKFKFISLNSDFAADFQKFAANPLNVFKDLSLDYSSINQDDPSQICHFLAYSLDMFSKDYPFIINFLDFLFKAKSSNGNNIAAFLKYYDKYIDNEYVVLPDNINAVQLLTIHKSKGLEFPAVIYVDFKSYSASNKNDWLVVNSELLGFNSPKYVLVNDTKDLELSLFKGQKLMADKMKDADKMNLAYVATTRARNELFVLAEKGSDYFQLLTSFIEVAKYLSPTEIENVFAMGQKQVYSQAINEAKTHVLNYSYFHAWQKIAKLNPQVFTDLNINEIPSDRIIGTVLHQIFSLINIKSDLNFAVNSTVLNMSIPLAQVGFYKDLVLKIIENAEFSHLFIGSWTVMNERNILTSNGAILRPDRILISETTVKVVDFKYSDYEEVAAENLQKYVNQINSYSMVLKEIYPNKKMEAYLLWLKNKMILQRVI